MLLSTLGRTEHIADIVCNLKNATYTMPTQGGLIPNDRFMAGIRLTVEMRSTNPAAGNVGQEADSPFSLLELIEVEGYHRIRGNREKFISVRGADLRELNCIMTNHIPYLDVGGVFGAPLALGPGAPNDVRFIVEIPFVPLQMHWRSQLNYLLDAPNYEQLQLTIRWSDEFSIFNGVGGVNAFSMYGGAGGNPIIHVEGIFAQSGANRFAGYVPSRVFRYFSEVRAGDIIGGGANLRLYNFPKGYFIRNLLFKTGVLSATATAGNNVYTTLSDVILNNIRVYRGTNKLNRLFVNMFTLKEDVCGMNGYAVRQPLQGYGMIDWAPHGLDAEVLDTRGLVAGPTGDVDLFLASDIVAGAAQGAMFLVEEWRYPAGTLVRK
jgi:hypothetical protein